MSAFGSSTGAIVASLTPVKAATAYRAHAVDTPSTELIPMFLYLVVTAVALFAAALGTVSLQDAVSHR